MSQSGVSVHPDCISVYNELKLGGGKVKYVIYKLSDDYKEIVVETQSSSDDYDEFRESLINATSVHRGKTGKGPRYAVYDFKYELTSGEGTRNKIAFISWSPDDASIGPKMTYASSKEALKNALTGIAAEVQANDEDDLEFEAILQSITRGKR